MMYINDHVLKREVACYRVSIRSFLKRVTIAVYPSLHPLYLRADNSAILQTMLAGRFSVLADF